MKILVAGFQHETNTFAPSRATYGEFVKGEGWPAIKRGAEVLSLRHANVPIAGFLAAMEPAGHALVTVLWAAANPSGPVTEDAFERIAGEIVEASRRHDPDAIYLDLHGAMVTEHYDDGEGELLARLRTATRDGTPIVASLDLHANVTARMQACADGLVAYRTYPHVDMAATGRRAAQLLHDLVASQSPVAKASRRLPFLIPINGMCTTVEPARGFYARLGGAERGGILSLSFAPGFPAADFPECGPMVWGYGLDADALNRAVDALYQDLLDSEPRWGTTFLSPDEAVREAIRMAGAAPKPVVIADTQDNPGAGGDGNTTGMLASLVRHNAQQAAIGLLHDPQAARAAHDAGPGASIRLTLGAGSGAPFEGTFIVENLSDGRCILDGPMMRGVRLELGPSACLRIGGVRVAVSTGRAQMMDRNQYRMVGIEPERMRILVNKSSVHFRADFEPIAQAVLVAKAPGIALADPGELPWTRLAPGMRLRPRAGSERTGQ
ncbi:M81 family metallopeptidase [Ralstonia pseudosolanacearum]|uniref:M81 family metallopeptidase n=1 Tax=Ralstonia solanacearum species complex TaxID=3116862 RepID=UPI0002F7D4F3|nr:M81 family metallopeptidase [Ralstonia pseudosolanacearum]MCD9231004.1 M81 family metallopeptidase [Ralstonia pseudosolanacearum]MCK4124926.1 M81 family metallopeptidase [Ralstonia pseudosolanacearum]QIK21749.1 M81 family metallopeptidase [Ralstonia solanacearum]